MSRLLMLDSGAFSVWNKGKSVNLSEYITFCAAHPEFDYYVSLDVIPGRANDKKLVTRLSVAESCRRGWDNYQDMIKELPRQKVLPVYHQNDDLHWLSRYLEDGVRYIGVSPANDEGVKGRLAWINSAPQRGRVSMEDTTGGLRKVLFDGAGRPVVKTHGFGVTSYVLMKAWPWCSVDSSTWQHAAVWGEVFFPKFRKGEFVYDESPYRIAVSDQSPHVSTFCKHLLSLTPNTKQLLGEWLQMCGVTCEEVSTDQSARAKVNATFVLGSNAHLPVEHIYLAGFRIFFPLEFSIPYRLLSYANLKAIQKYLTKWKEHDCERQPGRIAPRRRLGATWGGN